ncbi:hypothetical protein [uncultured Hymenobacter sp.]|uniref:hypothetical protein n=1 Tax=uncultured Hymenobacter sp. TaxID=170016 RepID=UPI0035C9AF21
MPTKNFYLDNAQTDVLTVKWGLFFRNFEAFHNGQSLGKVSSTDELRQGHHYELSDGRTLTARLARNQGLQELELLLDARPVPGSATHPHERLKQGWYMLLFLGCLNVGLGLAAELGQVELLQQLGLGWASLAEGLAFLVLGWLGYTRRSVPAFATALTLLVLDALFGIGASLASGQGPALGGLIARFFFCVVVFRGMKAAQQLRSEEPKLVVE